MNCGAAIRLTFIVPLVLLCSCTVPAPVSKEDLAREVMLGLKPGMTHREVTDRVATIRKRYRFPDSSCILDIREAERETNDFARIDTGTDGFLLVTYEQRQGQSGRLISQEDRVISVKAGSFEDIRSVVGDDLYAPVTVIQDCPSPDDSATFNPVALLKVVNQLQPLGREKALRALREYARLSDDQNMWPYGLDGSKVFLITRLLFTRKDGKAFRQPPGLGATLPDPSGTGEDWPIFPLATLGGIPFLINNGYFLAGIPEPGSWDVLFCEENCDIVREPYCPTTLPIEAAERLYESDKWKQLFARQDETAKGHFPEEVAKHHVRCQALRCYPNFILTERLEYDLFPGCRDRDPAEKVWFRLRKELVSKPVRWDAALNAFKVGN